MNMGIETITDNVGMSFDKILVLIVGAGGLCFYAKDFKLGLMLHFLAFGLLFAWFYVAGIPYELAETLMFVCLVLLALSLYATFGQYQKVLS